MSSTGAMAWNKHFKDKCPILTTIKKESIVYNQDNKPVGRVRANQPVIALESKIYLEKYPVQLTDKRIVYVTFNNIQKPKSKRISGIKLKPQDFKAFQNKTLWKSKDLAKALVDEIEERQDLDPSLKTYLIAITKYYAKLNNTSPQDVDSVYSSSMPGLAEIQKDYGEILGALAAINYGLLSQTGIRLNESNFLEFPLRGNEPIVDYYIHTGKNKLSISAKSGSTTNTLKPADVITLLGKNNSKWNTKPIYKVMELVRDKSVTEFPFYALNLIKPNIITNKALQEVSSKFKNVNFQSDKYQYHLFDSVYKYLGLNITKPLKIGELFYRVEKSIVNSLNEKYSPDDIFKDAINGLVIYVKFQISSQNKHGKFEVMTSDMMKPNKKIKWRSKNYAGKAADKVGFQT